MPSDLASLIAMHRFCRPAGSPTERAFITRYLVPLGATIDVHRNYHVQIGADTSVIWSSHTDTVHKRAGRQRVTLLADGRIRSDSRAGCLGADDTAGVWLMSEMIRANVPGHYIFHYGEEKGCIGSSDLAAMSPEILQGARIAVAFDRRGTTDVITHQCGSRTASDDFARGLSSLLNQCAPLAYAPDDSGLFTDTEQYAHLIPECTNVAIGYAGAHGDTETLETNHLRRLRDVLCTHGADVFGLDSPRDPAEVDTLWAGYSWADFEDDMSLPVASLSDRYALHFHCRDCSVAWVIPDTKYPDDIDYCPRCYADTEPERIVSLHHAYSDEDEDSY